MLDFGFPKDSTVVHHDVVSDSPWSLLCQQPPVGRRRCRQAGCQDLTVRARGGQAELRARKVSQSQDAMAADILYGRFGYAHTRANSEKYFASTTTTSFAKV
jgi:hypothetical protein